MAQSILRKLLSAAPVVPVAGLAFAVGQIIHSAHRPDLPSFPNQDPSGDFGDPDLPELRLVALGDSTITSPGVTELDEAWVRRIAIAISDRYHVTVRSVAVGGSKARDVIRNQLDAAVALRPDLAVIAIGANDALRATPLRRFEDELRQILRTLGKAADAVVIMGIGDMSTVPRLPDWLRPVARRRSRRIDEAITRIVAEVPNAVRPPMWGQVSDHFRSGDLTLFAGDQFHASGKGHGVFAEGTMPAIEKALEFVVARQAAG